MFDAEVEFDGVEVMSGGNTAGLVRPSNAREVDGKVCVCCSNIAPVCDAIDGELWDDDVMRPPGTRVDDCECLSTGLLLGVVLCGSSEIKLGKDEEDEPKASPSAPSTR